MLYPDPKCKKKLIFFIHLPKTTWRQKKSLLLFLLLSIDCTTIQAMWQLALFYPYTIFKQSTIEHGLLCLPNRFNTFTAAWVTGGSSRVLLICGRDVTSIHLLAALMTPPKKCAEALFLLHDVVNNQKFFFALDAGTHWWVHGTPGRYTEWPTHGFTPHVNETSRKLAAANLLKRHWSKTRRSVRLE